MKRIPKKLLLATCLGFVFGILWLFAVRFALVEKKETHYHANFALYVDGVREQFDNFTFYEEVQSCGGDEKNNPRTRTHMHDNIHHVVHVHDEAATWGHFFANLGFVLGNDILKTDDGVFVDGANNKKLTFILNGQVVDGVANATIRSEDALLISYGSDADEQLRSHYEGITKDATEYNKRSDPSACTGGKPFTLKERLSKTFRIAD